MSFKLYVGNLPYETTETELQGFFGKAGTVASVKVITDRETGRSRGFAFVEMESPEGGQKAISDLNGAAFGNRNIRVSEAKPRENGAGGGGGGRGFGGGGGGGAGRGFGRGGRNGGGGGGGGDRW